MTIQDQIEKVYVLCGNSAERAREDYATYVGDDIKEYEVAWRELCIRISMIIKARLFEALCSPNAYIREWGRLIKEEKQKNGSL